MGEGREIPVVVLELESFGGGKLAFPLDESLLSQAKACEYCGKKDQMMAFNPGTCNEAVVCRCGLAVSMVSIRSEVADYGTA